MELHGQENGPEIIKEGKVSHSKGATALQEKTVTQFKMKSLGGGMLHWGDEQEHRWG